MARNGAAFILCLTAESALPEVNAFLLMAGAKEVLCGDFPLSGFQTERAGVILQAAKAVAYPQKPITEPSIRDAYAVLTACAGPHFVPPAWEDFFVDVNHKLRHGAMRLVGTEQEGALAAVAMTVAEDESRRCYRRGCLSSGFSADRLRQCGDGASGTCVVVGGKTGLCSPRSARKRRVLCRVGL